MPTNREDSRIAGLDDEQRFECRIDNRQADGSAVLPVRSDVDLATAPDLESFIYAPAARHLITNVVDGKGLTFIDSSGLRFRVSPAREARSRGASRTVRNVPGHAQRFRDPIGLSD
jgi:anti-anti-sigma factor